MPLWKPTPGSSPYILAQSAIPVILPSSGSSNASGQVTLTTALPYQPSGTVSLYLPAGVVTAGSQGSGAGLYQVVFSSTTVCQLTGTGITSANGAYTQTTGADIVLANPIVPANAMGANGSVRTTSIWSMNNSGNSKTLKQRIGGASGATSMVVSFTTSNSFQGQANIRNRGAANLQIMFAPSALPYSASTSAATVAAVDTTADAQCPLQGQLATATDFIILDGYTVEVLPSS